MNHPTIQVSPSACVPGAGDAIRHGAIHLRVTDLGRARAFWGDALGLRERDRTATTLTLGTPGRDLVVLHSGAARPAPRGHAGLYHVAFHVPTEDAFGRALLRLAVHRVPQAPTDHIFSIATYAHDADGLGLEVTRETPRRVTGRIVTDREIALIDDDGRRRAPTEALDVRPILAPLAGGDPGPHADDDTVVGHVHLHVDDIPPAAAFYESLVGFDEHMRMDRIGMADFSAGGDFPHRLAVNVWQGPGAAPTPDDAAGLVHHELRVDPDGLAAIAERMDAAGHPYERRDGALWVRDPAGNALAIDARPV
ncbi:MAG: VOC family protein [Thermoleophilia bacterium]|nr:VOC family protein [Thermoleophilia bacterium]